MTSKSPMIALAHRGLWREPAEQNSLAALMAALEAGYGIETDVRDLAGLLVISHDPPVEATLTLDRFLEAAAAFAAPLALNVKSDGLASAVRDAVAKTAVKDAFVFDMSVPDSRHYQRLDVPFLTRRSEVEGAGPMDEDAVGIWLDAFHSDWWDEAVLSDLLDAGKRVAVVSSELHRRPHQAMWARLAAFDHPRRSAVMVCTDFPDEFVRQQAAGPI